MKKATFGFSEILFVCLISALVAVLPALCQENPNCPFHLCTPQRLGCSSNELLVDENGCEQCRCRENPAVSRVCPLHGCTTELLGCTAGLKRSDNNCTLCQCALGADWTRTGNSASHEESSLGESNLGIGGVDASDRCPPITCEELHCERLRINPETGCFVCECANENSAIDLSVLDMGISIELDPCPHATEILNDQRLRRGINRIVSGSDVPKYKLVLGKLKKGFQPGQKYKIGLKAVSTDFPFTEFLFKLKKAAFVALSERGKRKLKKVTPSSRGRVTSECGSGFYEESKNLSLMNARIIPQCPTAAVQRNKTLNKTMSYVEWVAPSCGCVAIKALVVDFTGTYAYGGEDVPTESVRSGDNAPLSGKTNRALQRIVCARASSLSKKKRFSTRAKSKKDRGNANKDWIFKECCEGAVRPRVSTINRKSKCLKNAMLFSVKKFYRYSGLKRKCQRAYTTCCQTIIESIFYSNSDSVSNGTSAIRHSSLDRSSHSIPKRRRPRIDVPPSRNRENVRNGRRQRRKMIRARTKKNMKLRRQPVMTRKMPKRRARN